MSNSFEKFLEKGEHEHQSESVDWLSIMETSIESIAKLFDQIEKWLEYDGLTLGRKEVQIDGGHPIGYYWSENLRIVIGKLTYLIRPHWIFSHSGLICCVKIWGPNSNAYLYLDEDGKWYITALEWAQFGEESLSPLEEQVFLDHIMELVHHKN